MIRYPRLHLRSMYLIFHKQLIRCSFVVAHGVLVAFLFCTQSAIGQDRNLTPKYSNEFLNIGVGARALGMSLSQVASVSDVTSGYWNPAGLTRMQNHLQVAAMHAEYFAGIAKYDYASVGKQIDSVSAASISFIRFGVDDIPNTTDLIDAGGNINYDRITSFSAADYAFLLSYARKGFSISHISQRMQSGAVDHRSAFKNELRWGVNAKIIYRHIGDFAQAWGFGLDAGAQYDLGNWHLGLVAKDITSTFNAWSYSLSDRMIEVFEQTGNEIPQNGLEMTLPRVIMGVARDFQFNKISLLAEANATFTSDGKRNVLVSTSPISIDPMIGIELGYEHIIFVRLGVGNAQRVTDFDQSKYITIQPNLGLGLKLKNLYIDYALSNIGNTSDVLYSNIFSLKLDIYKSKS